MNKIMRTNLSYATVSLIANLDSAPVRSPALDIPIALWLSCVLTSTDLEPFASRRAPLRAVVTVRADLLSIVRFLDEESEHDAEIAQAISIVLPAVLVMGDTRRVFCAMATLMGEKLRAAEGVCLKVECTELVHPSCLSTFLSHLCPRHRAEELLDMDDNDASLESVESRDEREAIVQKTVERSDREEAAIRRESNEQKKN